MSSAVDIIRSLHRLQTVTYLHVSGTALLVIDFLLTFGDEVTYAWPGPWNLGKVLFFATRYPAFIDSFLTLYHQVGYSLSAERCTSLFRITGWLIIIGIVIAEIILVIRVWAIYERKRSIAIFLILISVASVVSAGVGFAKFHGSQTFTATDSISPAIPGCFPSGGTNIVYVDFIVLLIFETIILGMTVVKAVQLVNLRDSNSFVYMFFKDGIMYYAVLQAISLVNVVVLFSGVREYTNLVTSMQRSLHAILSARILLHLRREATRNTTNGGSRSPGALDSQPIDELVFAHNDERGTGSVSRWGGDSSWFGDANDNAIATGAGAVGEDSDESGSMTRAGSRDEKPGSSREGMSRRREAESENV